MSVSKGDSMDRYIINITEEQYKKALSKFTLEEQELIKKMSKEFQNMICEMEKSKEV
jgi:hypothetical protein